MAVIEIEIEEEILCKRLKEYCFLNGKERDPRTCAVTFRRLAKLYMAFGKSAISLIRSAILLNAAISRNTADPSENLKADRNNLASIILHFARSRNRDVNLLSLSNQVSNSVKALRKTCSERLARLNRDHLSIKSETKFFQEKVFTKNYHLLQTKISEEYLKIMRNLFDDCVKIMGPAPCKWALVGIGPTARKEITPFSEFHHAVILDDQAFSPKVHHYFTWLMVIFHFVLINLGETPISEALIDQLNWFKDGFTVPGISACCSFKLAAVLPPTSTKMQIESGFVRQSSDMLKYLNLKPSTKTRQIGHSLAETCFVAGNESLYKNLRSKVKSALKSQRKNETQFYGTLQVRTDSDKKNLEILDKLYFLHSAKAVNYKQVIYESIPAFFLTLGVMYQVHKAVSHDIIEKLAKKGVIDYEERHRLAFADAVTYGCKLYIHVKHMRRDGPSNIDHSASDTLSEFFQAVGIQAVVEAFTISVRLQQAITALGAFTPTKPLKLKLNSYYTLLKSIVQCALNLNEKCIDCCKKLQRESTSPSGTQMHMARFLQAICLFRLNRPSQALPLFRITLRILPDTGRERITCCYYMGLCHMKNNKYKMAASLLLTGYRIQMKVAINEGSEIGLTRFLFEMGICAKRLNKCEEAINHFCRGLEIRHARPYDFEDVHESSWLHEAGLCHYQKNEIDEAVNYFKRAVRACRMESRNESCDKRLANLLFNLGSCLYDLEKYQEALETFEEELQIRLNFDVNSRDIAESQLAMEHCRRELQITTIF